jgi:outer membrane protein
MTRFILIVLAILIAAGTNVAQNPSPALLTPDQAVALALKNHPSVRSAEAAVRSAEAGLTQALSAYYPSVSANAGVTHNSGLFLLNPSIPPSNQTYDNYTTGFTGNLTIFDFGKTINRVSAGGSLADASRSDFTATTESVIMNTRIAYYALMQATQVEKANEQAAGQTARHLAEAKAFYSVGKRAQIDVTKAEVDNANANVNLITARNQRRVAMVQLKNAMGISTDEAFGVQDTFEVKPFTLTLDSVRTVTAQMRPEYLSARMRLEANKSLLSAAWEQHLPTISASGAYTWTNYHLSPLFSRWNAALTVSLPIFQGFGLQAQVSQAQAGVDAATANLDLLKQSIGLEVEQNYLSLREASDRIGATAKLVEQATENLTLAEKQYAAGVGTILEVADAQLTLTNARITRIQALYDYNSALVRLQRAMGTLKE